MSKILVHRNHRLPVAEVKGRLERAAKSVQQRHSMTWRWLDNALEVVPSSGIAQGARGRAYVSEGTVRVEVELPLRLRVAQRAVESKLRRKLDDLLG